MKEKILSYLPSDHPWRAHLQYFDTIDSTNTHAKKLAVAGAPAGTVLVAGQQTAGRGRLGRSFHSPEAQGVYLSVILRPQCLPTDLMHLTCATGTAMCDAIETVAGFRPGIKWINDLVFQCRKLGGILTELGFDPQTGIVRYAIVGIGINCSQHPEDFPDEIRNMAGSLSTATGRAVSPEQTAAAMIQALCDMDRSLLTNRSGIMDRYRADCITIGREVKLMTEPPRHGIARNVDDNGALVVQFEDGHIETVNAGEVSVRGLYGYV